MMRRVAFGLIGASVVLAGGLLLSGLRQPAPPPVGQDAPIAVPSGQPIVFLDSIWGQPGPSGLTLRFRFVAPRIGHDSGQLSFDDAEADMAYLCETYALPRISAMGPQPAQVIISLSDQPVPFGEMSPDVVQYFEAYRPQGTTCIWEGF